MNCLLSYICLFFKSRYRNCGFKLFIHDSKVVTRRKAIYLITFYHRKQPCCKSHHFLSPAVSVVLFLTGITMKVGWGRRFFLSLAWSTGVQLFVLFGSSVPVVLFDTAGISRCRAQHVVSVKSSSLFHLLM